MQMRQITSDDVIGGYTVFRNIISNYLGVLVDPLDPSHKKVPYSKAIPAFWGESFPLVYAVPASEVTVDKVFSRLTAVDDDFTAMLEDILADDDEPGGNARVVGTKTSSKQTTLLSGSKRMSIASGSADATDASLGRGVARARAIDSRDIGSAGAGTSGDGGLPDAGTSKKVTRDTSETD